MAINDEDILKRFTRLQLDGVELVLEVALITWDAGPHTPATAFVEVFRFPSDAPSALVARARRALLRRKRFFKVCTVCLERNPVGWMSDARICQGCAERTLGVVH